MNEKFDQNPNNNTDNSPEGDSAQGSSSKEVTWDVVAAAGREAEATAEQFEKVTRDVITARKELLELSEASRKNPEDDGAWQATRERSVALQALIKRRNELAEQMANEQPIE